MPGSVLTLSVHLTKNEFLGMVVIDGTEIPRLTSGSSSIDDPNAPQRETYELPLLPDTTTPGLEDLIKRNSKYKREQLKRNN